MYSYSHLKQIFISYTKNLLLFSKINHTEPVADAWLWICLLDIFPGKIRLLWKQGFNDKLTLFSKIVLKIKSWIFF